MTDAEALATLAARTYFETFASVNTPDNMQAYLSANFTVAQLDAELRDPRSTFYGRPIPSMDFLRGT